VPSTGPSFQAPGRRGVVKPRKISRRLRKSRLAAAFDGDRTRDISALHLVKLVMKGGKVY
jgi:hypothetical protein